MNSIKKRILNTDGIVLFLLFTLFPLRYLIQFNDATSFFLNLLKMITSVIVVVFFLEDIRAHFKKKFIIVFLILWAELFVSTIISKDASLYNYFMNLQETFPICFLIAEFALYNPRKGLKCLYFFFTTYVLANTITFILFPNALYADVGGFRCWLLGDDNTGYSYYLVASTIAMAYCSYIKGRVTFPSILVWISGFIFAFGRGIGSGMICQVIWAVLFLLYHFNGLKRILKARYVFYATAAAFFGIVVFRNLIFNGIVTAVGKDITLTGRTALWESTLQAIMRKPVLGYGVCDGETFGGIVSTVLTAPHNHILSVMFWGGIVAGCLFAGLICMSAKDASNARKTDFYRAMVTGLIAISIRLMVESGNYNHLYLLLSLLAYSPEFVAGIKVASTAREGSERRIRLRVKFVRR